MSIKIKDVRLLLPAFVSFENDGETYSVFVYIDQMKKDLIVPDSAGIDLDAFKQAFYDYYSSKNPVTKSPSAPNLGKLMGE